MAGAVEILRLHREAGVPLYIAKSALEEAGSYDDALNVLKASEEHKAASRSPHSALERAAIREIRKVTGVSAEHARDLLSEARGEIRLALRLTNRVSARVASERLARGNTLSGVEVHGLQLSGEWDRLRFQDVVLVRPVFTDLNVEQLSFKGCQLTQPVFNGLSVARDVAMNRCETDILRIKRASIDGQLNLSDSRFGLVEVRDSVIAGRVKTWDSQFSRWVSFRRVSFEGLADFRSLTCDEGLVFEDCRFAADLLLRGAHVKGRFDLRGSDVLGCVDLERSKLYDFVYLEDVNQGTEQTWRFVNMLGHGILIRAEQVSDRLASEVEGDYETAAAEYSLLRRIWGDLDRHREEDWAFHHFKIASRRAVPRSWRRPSSKIGEFFEWLLLDKGCAYGTNPFRALHTGIVVVIAFGMLYAAGIEAFDRSNGLMPGGMDDRLVTGFLISASVFAANFEQVALASGRMAIAILIEAGLGLLLFGLFVVAFSRKIIR